MRINEKKLKNKKGFTLIELIIVIAIIAILAAIAIPNFLSIQRKAKMNANIATGKEIYDATLTLMAEGKIKMPEHTVDKYTDKNGEVKTEERWGYSISLKDDLKSKEGQKKNDTDLILDYLQTKPVPEIYKGSYYVVNVMFKCNNKTYDITKPIVTVTIANSERTVGTIYPEQTGTLKLGN